MPRWMCLTKCSQWCRQAGPIRKCSPSQSNQRIIAQKDQQHEHHPRTHSREPSGRHVPHIRRAKLASSSAANANADPANARIGFYLLDRMAFSARHSR